MSILNTATATLGLSQRGFFPGNVGECRFMAGYGMVSIGECSFLLEYLYDSESMVEEECKECKLETGRTVTVIF